MLDAWIKRPEMLYKGKKRTLLLSEQNPNSVDYTERGQDEQAACLAYAMKKVAACPGIDAYVIMPNHVHMIVRIEPEDGAMWASTPTQSISDRIRSLKTLVSKKIGVSIWQRSFYDHVIRSEKDYLSIRQYIDDNPAGWAEDEYYYAE